VRRYFQAYSSQIGRAYNELLLPKADASNLDPQVRERTNFGYKFPFRSLRTYSRETGRPQDSMTIFTSSSRSPWPGLNRSRINDQLHVIPDSDPGSRLSRDSFYLALPPMYFLLWQKEAKPVSQVKSPGCILRSAGLRTYPLNCWPWAFAKTCGKRQREIPVFRLRRKPA
jgi:hypothetical protein